MRTPDRWLAVGGVAVAVGVAMAYRTTQENSILGNHDRLLAEIMLWWLAFAVALTCLRRTSLRAALVLVVLGTVALRLAALTAVVPLSDDLYRYAWDGQVQAAGISPYRYAPTAPELAELRTDWLFPAARECEQQIGRDAGCTRINRENVRTIYPPVAQAWFLLGHSLGASELRDLGWELMALVADLATVVLLWRLLLGRGRDPRWVAVYAWSPLAVLEAVQNGHVDGLATFFVVLAVGLAGRRPGWSGAALGVATMMARRARRRPAPPGHRSSRGQRPAAVRGRAAVGDARATVVRPAARRPGCLRGAPGLARCPGRGLPGFFRRGA